MKWCNGESYLGNTGWDAFQENTVYYGCGTYCNIGYANLKENTIVEFSDYFTEEKTSNEIMKIIVSKDGGTITAKAYMDNICVKEALVNAEEVVVKQVIQKLWL